MTSKSPISFLLSDPNFNKCPHIFIAENSEHKSLCQRQE